MKKLFADTLDRHLASHFTRECSAHAVRDRQHDTVVICIKGLRLDHEFTVFGQIVDGLEVMDRIVEGDVITRIEIR